VIDELDLIGLIGRQEVMEWRHHMLPFAYPVYSIDYARDVAIITDGLASLPNLDPIGRAGNFFYSHLHDQLRLGRDYVQSLVPANVSSGSDERKATNLNLASR